MKSNIHPKWYNDAVVTCSCGNTFKTGSVNQSIKVDICYACHPFFTGEMKFVDVQGRVEKFQQKQKLAQSFKATVKAKKQSDKVKAQAKSLKDMMAELKAQKNQAAASKA